MPRLHCDGALDEGSLIDLPAGAARHVQVLRLQPGHSITLFGPAHPDHEIEATITRMGRSQVQVRVGAARPLSREPAHAVHLAVGMPANERMDWLVEKAVELGVASIQPLHTHHGVLRLSSERAQRKQSHWQGIAIAACEQCGRNRVPAIHPVLGLHEWLAARAWQGRALVLSLQPASRPLAGLAPDGAASTFLSGPEGGLSADEEAAALAAGFVPVSLGARVLRAETAALAALTWMSLTP